MCIIVFRWESSSGLFFYNKYNIFVFRKNYGAALRTRRVKTQPSHGTERSASVRGRRGRKSAKRRRRKRRNVKRRENAKGRRSGSVRGSETESGSEIARGTGGRDEATPTAATPAEHQRRNGAGPAIAGGPGAETGTENGSAAGVSDCPKQLKYLLFVMFLLSLKRF